MDKPTLILALAFFMVSAPNPDSDAIAEMTANFIVPKNEFALNANDRALRPEEAQETAATVPAKVGTDSK